MTTFPNRRPVGESFPQVEGNSLSGKKWSLPQDLQGKPAILLVGFIQKSQFDIDRWLIGLEQYKFKGNVFEVPAIQGFFPRIFERSIDEGMREGIPENLWKVVITVYEDGEQIHQWSGNQYPLNARVILLDQSGKVRFFHDRGFSAQDLTALVKSYAKL